MILYAVALVCNVDTIFGTRMNRIVAMPRREDKGIVTVASVHTVIASASVDGVVAITAVDGIVASAATQRINPRMVRCGDLALLALRPRSECTPALGERTAGGRHEEARLPHRNPAALAGSMVARYHAAAYGEVARGLPTGRPQASLPLLRQGDSLSCATRSPRGP